MAAIIGHGSSPFAQSGKRKREREVRKGEKEDGQTGRKWQMQWNEMKIRVTNTLIIWADLETVSRVAVKRRNGWWHAIHWTTLAIVSIGVVLVFLFPFHATILEPNLDLSFSQTKCMSYFYAPSACKVPVEVKFFFQFKCLVSSVRLSSTFSF